MTTTLETALQVVQERLEALKAELPRFHSLLTEAEKEAHRLKNRRADLDEQATARGRVIAAREMLGEHQAEIERAKEGVAKLEQEVAHESVLRTMTAHAKAATRHRSAFEAALEGANAALLEHVAKLAAAAEGLEREQSAFRTEGRKLSRAFGVTFWGYSIPQATINEEQRKADAALEAIEARGVDPYNALTPLLGPQRTVLEPTEARPLARPQPFWSLLWQALEVYQRHQAERGDGA